MPDNDTYLSPLVSCIECRAEKSAKGIFSHFITSHTEEGRQKIKRANAQSNVSSKRLENAHRRERDKISKMSAYLNDAKFCECGNTIDYKKRNNKFCSQSCAARYSNLERTSEQTEKRLHTLRDTISHKQTEGRLQKMCKISFCVECNNLIKNKHAKTCQKECRTSLNTKNGSYAGRCSASKRKDQKRSKDEIALFNLCHAHFADVTHNDNTIANGWDADILLYDHKVAILWNGPWHYREMGFSNHQLKHVQNRDNIKIKEFKKVGWTVEIFEDRFYTPTSAFEILKSKYGSP